MRNLLLLGGLILAASMAGWFSIDRTDGETTIKINRNEIRNDAKQAIDKGRNYLNRHDDPYRPGQPNYQGDPATYAGPSAPPQDLRYDYSQYNGQPSAEHTGGYRPPAYQPIGSDQPLRYQDYGAPRPPAGSGQTYQERYPTQSAGYPQQNQYSR